MEFKIGRLIDHIHLRVFTCDELLVSVADGEIPRVHLAFQTDSLPKVNQF